MWDTRDEMKKKTKNSIMSLAAIQGRRYGEDGIEKESHGYSFVNDPLFIGKVLTESEKYLKESKKRIRRKR